MEPQQPEEWPKPNRWFDNFNLPVVHVMIGPAATRENIMELLQKTPAHIAICQCLPKTDRADLAEVERALKAATECERSARHDEVALPRLQCRRLGTEPDAGYIVWQPNKIKPPQPAAAVAVGGCTLQILVCHTVSEWDKPSDRVTLGVMNLGEEIRFSDGFLAAAQAAIKHHDVHLLTGFFGDTYDQISALCEAAVAAGRHAACQPWRTAGSPHRPLLGVMQWPNLESASAAWGSDAQALDCYQVFPAYICCLGPSFKEHQGGSL